MSLKLQIPKFITHYNRSKPFRSVTQSSQDKWPEIVRLLNESTSWGIERFSDPEYLVRRLDVERRIRSEFIARGGRPTLSNPIYFFLGRNSQFEARHENVGYIVDLKDIEPDSVTFTYGDSMFCFDEDYRNQAGEKYQNSLCAKIYRVEELENLITNPNFPEEDPLPLEVQLWQLPPADRVKILER